MDSKFRFSFFPVDKKSISAHIIQIQIQILNQQPVMNSPELKPGWFCINLLPSNHLSFPDLPYLLFCFLHHLKLSFYSFFPLLLLLLFFFLLYLETQNSSLGVSLQNVLNYFQHASKRLSRSAQLINEPVALGSPAQPRSYPRTLSSSCCVNHLGLINIMHTISVMKIQMPACINYWGGSHLQLDSKC